MPEISNAAGLSCRSMLFRSMLPCALAVGLSLLA